MGAWRSIVGAGIAAAACTAISMPARAQEFPDITDRDYALDLYVGPVLGSVRIVGMGGASVATAEGSAGSLANPAAPAVRPSTSTDAWDWDFHLDWLSPQLGSDFDNNGMVSEDISFNPVATVGLVGLYRNWAVGATATFARNETALDGAMQDDRLVTELIDSHVLVARSFRSDQLVIGGGLRVGRLNVNTTAREGDREPALFSLTGASLEAGAVLKPRDKSYRVGATLGLPITSERVAVQNCDPLDCAGYILPERVAVPWRIAGGWAWRRAATPWNRSVNGDWRDEKYLLLAADLVLTGPVEDGHGLEAFGRGQLQPSGRSVAVSGRVGAEYEWLPGRLRVRGGGYWEPSRFEDPAGEPVPGRLHITVGLDVRVWSFCFWNDRYRLRLSLTGDGAERYANSGVSLGLWH